MSSAYSSHCSYSSSFNTSGGEYPNGYCVWMLSSEGDHSLVSCHCKEGYVCGWPFGPIRPRYDGEIVKIACVKAGTAGSAASA